jgi:outer membrane protein OmpA-like peptidoglycan-associated protein
LKIKTEKETVYQDRDVEVERDLRFVRFYYETNVFKLDADQIKRLNNLINVYKQNDDFKIMISGYADGSGNSEYNRKLTDRRIGEIISYMISQGVDKERIYSISYGDQKSSESENPQDRRVEVRIFDFY